MKALKSIMTVVLIVNMVYAKDYHFDSYGGEVSTGCKSRKQSKDFLLKGKGSIALDDIFAVVKVLWPNNQKETATTKEVPVHPAPLVSDSESNVPSVGAAAQEQTNNSPIAGVTPVVHKSYLQQFKDASTPVQCAVVGGAMVITGVGICIGKKLLSK